MVIETTLLLSIQLNSPEAQFPNNFYDSTSVAKQRFKPQMHYRSTRQVIEDINTSTSRESIPSGIVHKGKSVTPLPIQKVPLDLSVRRSSPVHQVEKENKVSSGSTSSLPSPRSSRSNCSDSPRTRVIPPPPMELAPRLAQLPPTPVPNVLVRQAVFR